MVRSGYVKSWLLACGLASACTAGAAAAPAIELRAFGEIYNAVDPISPVTPQGCRTGDGLAFCEYRTALGTTFRTNGRIVDGPLREVGVYLPPIERSGTDAAYILTKLLTLFSPSIDQVRRQDALRSLISGAAGIGRRGEAILGDVRYVLRANDGRSVRIYVTIVEGAQ